MDRNRPGERADGLHPKQPRNLHPTEVPVVEVFPNDFSRGAEWSVEEAEGLISSLTGVLSARIVTGHSGEIDEVHVLTSHETSPKQTVRNVESALRAHFDVRLDHRKISVAQTSKVIDDGIDEGFLEEAVEAPEPLLSDDNSQGATERETTGRSGPADVHTPDAAPARERAEPERQEPAARRRTSEPEAPDSMPLFVDRQATGADGRILFQGYRTDAGETHPHRIGITVALEWSGERFTGEASATMLPKTRLEALATATLRALEAMIQGAANEAEVGGTALILEGVKAVMAFDREHVLVSVHGLAGPEVTPLVGAAPVRESQDHAAVRATLQATDRWVRGKL